MTFIFASFMWFISVALACIAAYTTSERDYLGDAYTKSERLGITAIPAAVGTAFYTLAIVVYSWG